MDLRLRAHRMRRLIGVALTSLFVTGLPLDGVAQDYPNRHIRVIMPLGPGGVGDVFLRALGLELTKALGQSIVVENRPGGGTIVGAQQCALAKPDGYTLCMLAIDALSIAPFLSRTPPYDPEKDFVPIMRFFFIVEGMMVHPSLKVGSVAELIALSKQKPGTLSYATQAHALSLFMEGFKKDTGADLQRVPFQSGGDATNAVLGGHVPVGYFGLGNLIAHVRDGGIKLLAVDTKADVALSGSADARGGRLPRHRDKALVGPVCAGRNPAGDRPPAARPIDTDPR